MWNNLLKIGEDLVKQGSGAVQAKAAELINHAEYEVKQLQAGNINRAGINILKATNPDTKPVYEAVENFEQVENIVTKPVADFVEEKTGIPAPVTQTGLLMLTPGAGEVKPALRGASNTLLRNLPAKPAHALTIKNSDFIARGVQQGSASGSDFGPAMTKWRNRRMELREQMRNPAGNTPHRRQQNARGSREVAYNDVSTGPTTDPLDVIAYGRGAHKVKGKEQHHLFPKQESYQFVERMNEIGDQDDVLNLFLYAEEVDATMGGRLSDILNMDIKPHTALHRNRVNDGRQLKAIEMGNLVRSARSTDELMTLFNRYVTENIKPSKAEARKLQQAFEQAKTKNNKFNSLTIKDRQRL